MIHKMKIINEVIKREGGYVNDPRDSGGETNWGITKAVAKAYGYHGSIRNMSQKTAFDIYEQLYWAPMRLDDVQQVASDIADELMDTGVNMGVARASKFLQQSLNALNNGGDHFDDVVVDGIIGNKTLKAFSAYIKRRRTKGVTVLLRMLNSLQGAFYIKLAERREKDEKFIHGWFVNRVS